MAFTRGKEREYIYIYVYIKGKGDFSLLSVKVIFCSLLIIFHFYLLVLLSKAEKRGDLD